MEGKDKYFVISDQIVTIETDILANRILDIGGGGDGVIGSCYGSRVVSIDPREDELQESENGPLKIVMDACEMKFLDSTFDAATSFFTMMYINADIRPKAFQEIYRVLKPQGEFVLWDTFIPSAETTDKDIFLINLKINTPKKSFSTGYGVSLKDKEQSLDYYCKLGKEIGFSIDSIETTNKIYKITFTKQ